MSFIKLTITVLIVLITLFKDDITTFNSDGIFQKHVQVYDFPFKIVQYLSNYLNLARYLEIL